jgi:hypothetical protein
VTEPGYVAPATPGWWEAQMPLNNTGLTLNEGGS